MSESSSKLLIKVKISKKLLNDCFYWSLLGRLFKHDIRQNLAWLFEEVFSNFLRNLNRKCIAVLFFKYLLSVCLDCRLDMRFLNEVFKKMLLPGIEFEVFNDFVEKK
jgi:hypothetical protein